MPRAAGLSLSQLESREVLSATLFADIRPGVWGSNPTMLGVSGDTLYFSANNIYQGTELWASDGTVAGTHMVKDLNPGKPGSGLYGVPVGGGVMFLIQQNEGSVQQTDYKTDGTEAGTVQVTYGLHSIVAAGGTVLTGWKGDLYYVTAENEAGVRTLMKTDGTTNTPLTTFNDQPLHPTLPALGSTSLRVLNDRIELTIRTTVGPQHDMGPLQVWQTDSTAAGTTLQQTDLTMNSPTMSLGDFLPGVEIRSGQYVFRSWNTGGDTDGTLLVGGATAATRQVIRQFDGAFYSPYSGVFSSSFAAVGGKVVFNVVPKDAAGTVTAHVGIWITDGTTAGTIKLAFPSFGNRTPIVRGSFDGKALVQVPTADVNKWDYMLTDGTTTTPVPTPAGMSSLKWYLSGKLPADAANPKGALLFQEVIGGKSYRTDGTAAGTGLIDTTGLPKSPVVPTQQFYWNNWDNSANFVGDGARGFYFKGAVYYPGRNPDIQRNTQEWVYGTELWKWDMTPATTTPTPTPAPKVTGTRVNDGSAQRSMVKTLTVTFDSAVTVNPAGVTIFNAAGTTTAFSQQLTTVNGKTTLTITFPSQLGGSIADGRWTLKINAGAVKSQTGGTPMAANYTYVFTRVYGDISGDGIYDRSTRTTVSQLLGRQIGDPGFDAAYDVNGDGKIDATDELAAVRNWGKSV